MFHEYNTIVLEKVDLNEVGSKTNKMVKMFGVLLLLSPLPSSLSYKVNSKFFCNHQRSMKYLNMNLQFQVISEAHFEIV